MFDRVASKGGSTNPGSWAHGDVPPFIAPDLLLESQQLRLTQASSRALLLSFSDGPKGRAGGATVEGLGERSKWLEGVNSLFKILYKLN